MKPSGSLLLLVSMAYLFLCAGEYDAFMWNRILGQTGQWQQSWCAVVVDDDDGDDDDDDDDDDCNYDKDG